MFTVGTSVLYVVYMNVGLSPRKSGLVPGLVQVIIVVDKMVKGQDFLALIRFPPVSIIPPVIHLDLSSIVTSKTRGGSLEGFKQSYAPSFTGEHGT